MNRNNIISQVIKILQNNGVIVLPTDTVYGLCADFKSKKAKQKIYAIKGRDTAKPLSVFVYCIHKAKNIAKISKKQEQIINVLWPGKVTIILNKKEKQGTIALRIPNHPLILNILKELKKPLWQTSANLSGKNTNKSIKELQTQLKNNFVQPDLIIDGGILPENESSTILDLTKKPYHILRHGADYELVHETLKRISS